ncbi:MgtC/SapB family protein [Mycetocola spongiae]|uniref:MgtC/SapB family protein n=1 Tax=Mycetocola spongiae TaxID=2859226 RepID=UPI001CF1A28B|nr:MgtC/SapB family protein [Mycetocola spongiae]UCR89546.1 MgtC/SapB family protein [Mycetocola spongiae]
MTIDLFPPETLTMGILLLCAFILSAVIGAERQLRHKNAGIRTHTLVGLGAAVFTLVSAYGFAPVLGPEVNLDPSRIAAQVVSGIGFLGAGVIFVRQNIVSGLTTAASIWLTAAIGMACGAGLPVLAVAATLLHLLTVTVISRLFRWIRSRSVLSGRTLLVRYREGKDVLRHLLDLAASYGFAANLDQLIHEDSDDDEGRNEVTAHMTLVGGHIPISGFLEIISSVKGITMIRVLTRDDDQDGD